MAPEPKTFQEQIEELKKENYNLRFDGIQQKLIDIEEMIKNFTESVKITNEIITKDLKATDVRLGKVEEYQRNCPVKTMKSELIRYSKETSFVRELFKNPWKGTIIFSVWVIILTVLVILFGPSSIMEAILQMKGL